MTGEEVVEEWERRQEAGRYNSYSHSMADLAAMIDEAAKPKPYVGNIGSNPCGEIAVSESTWDYREDQARWREAGFNAYNCDRIDEFPTW